MYRASPPRTVAEFAKAAVAAAEVYGVDFALTDFVNLERSTVTHSGGFATGEFALLPDKAQYDRVRFLFGKPTMGNADNTCTLELWVVGYIAVGAIGGSTAAVTVDVKVQGTYQGYVN